MFEVLLSWTRKAALLAAALFPIDVSPAPVEVKTCDMVELNHYYDDNGKHIFTQTIFWLWNGERYEVLGWRMVNDREARWPQRRGDQWRTLMDRTDGRLIIVLSPLKETTWTQQDPELLDRQWTPKHKRRWP